MGSRVRWKSFFVFLCCLLCLSACQKSAEQQIAEQLELAQKYLVELKYEEAAIAFQKVIELDPKQLPAYQGLGEVYLAQAEQKENEGQLEAAETFYGQAMQMFKKILELDPENGEASERLSVLFSKVSNLEDLLNVLEQMPEENETLKEWQRSIQFLQDLIELLEKGDPEANEELMTLMWETEYTKFCDLCDLFVNEEPCIWKLESEKGIGFYLVDDEEMIYYGDYNGANREGYGVWIGEYYLAEGEWKEDLPNGYQIEYWDWNESVEGVVENGLWNGIVKQTSESSWIERIGKYDVEFYQFVQGECQILYYDEDGSAIISYVNNEDEEYWVVGDEKLRQKRYGIQGFGEEWL